VREPPGGLDRDPVDPLQESWTRLFEFLYVRQSADDGATWSNSVRVNDDAAPGRSKLTWALAAL
jgi:hypothetical protein